MRIRTLTSMGASLVLLMTLLMGNSLSALAAPAQLPLAQGKTDEITKGDQTDTVGEASGAVAPAVATLDDVQQAVVQIVAVGTFHDPAEGMQANAAGAGSGFIIDPAGIAVTNNHVVTGAAFLKVFVAGEKEPRSARVLGVDECSDLAVIDIEGEGFPYLEWYKGSIKVGLEIYAAGFPLGDPEYTLTRGIVAKAKANGQTGWASVDHVIQHDAETNPGNSGGPVITKDGQVVAIHYAGDSEHNQFFAIANDVAGPIVKTLRGGEDLNYVGLNAEAISDGKELAGLWVNSVASGSPADNAGIKPGDILTKLEGVDLATDGTKATYCDILKSHQPADTLTVQVLRMDTAEVLEGQLNGRPLELSFSVAQEQAGQGGNSGGTGDNSGPASYAEFATVSTADGSLAFEAPTVWQESDEGEWKVSDEVVGIKLVASPSIDDLLNSWGTPGIFVSVSTDLAEQGVTLDDLLDGFDLKEQCKSSERKELPEGTYTGKYDVWEGCGNEQASAFIVALMPQDQSYLVQIEGYTLAAADVDAVNHAIDSFVVNVATATTGEGNGSSTAPVGSDIGDLIDTSKLAYDYTLVSEPGILSVLLPTKWKDIETGDWEVDGKVIGKSFAASPDLKKYQETWTTPGLYVRSMTDLGEEVQVEDYLDNFDLSENCERGERLKHNHEIYGLSYSGAFDVWGNCDETGNAYAFLAALSADGKQLILAEFQVPQAGDADIEAWDIFLRSFFIDLGAATSSTAAASDAAGAADYKSVTDETGTLVVQVPTDWIDLASGSWTFDDQEVGVALTVAPNVQKYNETWSMPGLFFAASEELAATYSVEDILDAYDFSKDCEKDDRLAYDDGVFVGSYDLWTQCAGKDGNLFVVLVAAPKEDPDRGLVMLNVSIPAGTNEEAFKQILNSFTVQDPANGAGDAAGLGDSSGGDNSATNTPEAPAAPEVTATVVATQLNVRKGPGTNFPRVTAVKKGDALGAIGRNTNCSWIMVVTENGEIGWVAGTAQYVKLDGKCADLPVTSDVVPSTTSGGSTTGGNTGSANASKGCYTWENQIGAEVTVTLTRVDGGNFNKTFKITKGQQHEECVDPGKYTYTLDAPPPWNSVNGELKIAAGDNYLFPIQAE